MSNHFNEQVFFLSMSNRLNNNFNKNKIPRYRNAIVASMVFRVFLRKILVTRDARRFKFPTRSDMLAFIGEPIWRHDRSTDETQCIMNKNETRSTHRNVAASRRTWLRLVTVTCRIGICTLWYARTRAPSRSLPLASGWNTSRSTPYLKCISLHLFIYLLVYISNGKSQNWTFIGFTFTQSTSNWQF